MPSIILILVGIAAALAMASGVWVATALIRALVRNKPTGHNPPTEARP
ncbi:MAG TPA: hypothetical protein VJJ98_06150 [Sedimentisphaerales bacterium]|nr:hypothetical protein [Sedimentisphaerales bacterium]